MIIVLNFMVTFATLPEIASSISMFKEYSNGVGSPNWRGGVRLWPIDGYFKMNFVANF